mmetsp:Transcript_28376/g.91296  ORF Transcript_28376/g.91296 Transcript_28376/m.91296 type:complete len:293 (+) Transcript_28376:481-1359(+)
MAIDPFRVWLSMKSNWRGAERTASVTSLTSVAGSSITTRTAITQSRRAVSSFLCEASNSASVGSRLGPLFGAALLESVPESDRVGVAARRGDRPADQHRHRRADGRRFLRPPRRPAPLAAGGRRHDAARRERQDGAADCHGGGPHRVRRRLQDVSREGGAGRGLGVGRQQAAARARGGGVRAIGELAGRDGDGGQRAHYSPARRGHHGASGRPGRGGGGGGAHEPARAPAQAARRRRRLLPAAARAAGPHVAEEHAVARRARPPVHDQEAALGVQRARGPRPAPRHPRALRR